MNNPLVSIIIPTYNRADLIGETLDSILAQTYENWECIIVDDGSEDNTKEIVLSYIEKDARFQYFKRPENKPKGGNSCRNYGFEICKGEYVNWFDSDDIMLSQKIEKQLNFLKSKNIDFCVSRFDNFNDFERTSEIAFDKNNNQEINLYNYLSGNVFWGTIDFLGRKKILINSKFDETLKSGQEYNFFISVMTNKEVKGDYVSDVLSLRRIHQDSIQQRQMNNSKQRLRNKFNIYWHTYNQNKSKIDRKSLLYLLKMATLFYHKLFLNKEIILPLSDFVKEIHPVIGKYKTVKVMILFIMAKTLGIGDLYGSKIIKKNFEK